MSSSTTSPTAPLIARNPSRSGSLDAGVGLYNKNWRYGYFFAGCFALLAAETGIWRRYFAPLCGSYCNLNLSKEASYFKFASNGFDYAKMDNLQYPAGVLYFYQLISGVPSFVKQAVPMVMFAYFLFLSAYLMKRCRIPAGLMLFFAVPLGILLQGHALMFILPEMLGMTVFLQTLAALVAGYQRTAMVLLIGAMSLDSVRVLPLIPAIMLCLMRTMGARRASFWMTLVFIGFALISGRYLLTNPTAYLVQCFALQPRIRSSWNPIVWWVHFLEDNFKMSVIGRAKLEQLLSSVLPGMVLRCCLQLFLINFRWLKSDGGILGLISKFMKSNRGHGIRPNPWTPRQTLTVVFETMLVSVLLRFPSLVHAEEFELLTVMVSGFFCVALADPVPLPALFGIFAALSFPLSYLYRQYIGKENVHFHLGLKESIHFLPMLFLPIAQLAVLLLFKRRDVGGVNSSQKSPTPSAASLSPLNSVAKGFAHHHRRSSSLSRRKID